MFAQKQALSKGLSPVGVNMTFSDQNETVRKLSILVMLLDKEEKQYIINSSSSFSWFNIVQKKRCFIGV